MNPSRRNILKQLLVGVGASVVLPASGSLSPSSQPKFYRAEEFEFLSRLSDLIIPETETPGALAAQVPAYLDALFNEWANSETQSKEKAFLQALGAELSAGGQPFSTLSDLAAAQKLEQFDAQAYASGQGNELADEYRQLKQRITSAYAISEVGALQELNWQAVPGKWIPSMPIAEQS